MKKREITGISIENDLLRLATLVVARDAVRITRVRTIKLNSPVGDTEAPALPDKPAAEEDSIFGLDIGSELAAAGTAAEEPWDMTEDGTEEEFGGGSNAARLAAVLSAFHPGTANIALAIPAGRTFLQTLDKADPKSVGKKAFTEDLKGTLKTLHGRHISDDQLRYQLRGDRTLLLASIDAPVPALDLVDQALPFFKGKINVRDMVPEEILLMGLIRANYDLADHQYTCIIHMDDHNTRILFMYGREFHSILPEINEGAGSPKVHRTVFSKILFEVDRGKVPTLDRIIITGNTGQAALQQYLSEQFLDVDIGPFDYSPHHVEVVEPIAGKLDPYILAIAAAWSALDTGRSRFLPFSFVPKYVQTRQQVFKLDWHGYILLLLIALTPVVLNSLYIGKRTTIRNNESRLTLIGQQIGQNRLVSDEVDRLSAEFTLYNRKVQLLDTLGYNTMKWSTSLGLLNTFTESIKGYWIRSVQANDDQMVIQGTALYRDRIPPLSNSFERAVIQQVTEREYRGITVYDFTLRVTGIVNDYRLFRPEPVRLPPDLLQGPEPDAAGTIENQ